jgi:hypothetical protein
MDLDHAVNDFPLSLELFQSIQTFPPLEQKLLTDKLEPRRKLQSYIISHALPKVEAEMYQVV